MILEHYNPGLSSIFASISQPTIQANTAQQPTDESVGGDYKI